jgi:hypothetical protein
MTLSIRFGGFVVTALALASGAQADSYSPGFIWDRSADWDTTALVYGTSIGNPMPDSQGNPTWSLEWVSGDGLDSPNPWYTQVPNPMIWDYWAPANVIAGNSWVRVDDLEPKIMQTQLTNSRSLSWDSWDYQALVRWSNPTEATISADIDGNLRLVWGGSFSRIADTAVDVVVAKYCASSEQFTSLLGETISNPKAVEPDPYPSVPMDIPVSFSQVAFDPGDSLIISLRATTAPSTLASWVILRDDVTIKMVSSVPEPSVWLTMALGIPLLAVGAKQAKNAAG